MEGWCGGGVQGGAHIEGKIIQKRNVLKTLFLNLVTENKPSIVLKHGHD